MPTRVEIDLRSVKPLIANASRIALELLASPHLSNEDRTLVAKLLGQIAGADVLLGEIVRKQEDLTDGNGQKHG
jgi:hypothetical protein